MFWPAPWLQAIEVAISESAEKETGPADIMRKLEYLRREEELIREEELEAEALLSSGDQPSPVQASQVRKILRSFPRAGLAGVRDLFLDMVRVRLDFLGKFSG